MAEMPVEGKFQPVQSANIWVFALGGVAGNVHFLSRWLNTTCDLGFSE